MAEEEYLFEWCDFTDAWKKHTVAVGGIPRANTPVLTNRHVVNLCERQTRIGEIAVAVSNLRLKMIKKTPPPIDMLVKRYSSRLRTRT